MTILNSSIRDRAAATLMRLANTREAPATSCKRQAALAATGWILSSHSLYVAVRSWLRATSRDPDGLDQAWVRVARMANDSVPDLASRL
ncbi:Mycobacterium numidiamassiliense ORFan [Mycobacterium numidiamassiliense]|uniref:Mycobacterium numidiamassiliense ORFan n=1 Tax=Mycobacterium numidiamassiliense TaxID=1841861 RepID=A0A2U3PH34_9MYCO|nr:Mycobacterium numidiamassiliense ORFan [Mycobacterium numidiamassiliense]